MRFGVQAASSVNWTAKGIQSAQSPVPKPRNDFVGGLHLAGFDLTVAQRQHPQQSYALLHPLVAVGAGPCGAATHHQPDISCSMATVSFSTRWMSASISSSGRGGRYS